jgi:hypothetical protein
MASEPSRGPAGPLLARRSRASRYCARLRRGYTGTPTQMLPPLARAVAEGLLPAATVFGWQVAVIRPERAEDGPRGSRMTPDFPTGRRTTGRLGDDCERPLGIGHSGSSVVANDRRLAIQVHGRRPPI